MDNGTISYIEGNALTKYSDKNIIIMHCCNNLMAWGAGFSGELSKKWPITKSTFLKHSNVLGAVSFVQVESTIYVANIVGQNGYGYDGKKYVDYSALQTAFLTIVTLINNSAFLRNNIVIQCPRIGCGLAGGKWEEIEPLLSIFTNAGIDVIVCDLKK